MRFILKLLLIFIWQLAIGADFCQAQFYQKADYGDISVTRKNQLGGYDYYDKEGKIVGYSEKTHKGDYIYYDNEGNTLGALKQEGDSYTFYNVDDIATGKIRKTPTGEYRYRDKLEGGLRSITPPPGEDISFFPPSSFLEGTFSPQLEGGFKKEQAED